MNPTPDPEVTTEHVVSLDVALDLADHASLPPQTARAALRRLRAEVLALQPRTGAESHAGKCSIDMRLDADTVAELDAIAALSMVDRDDVIRVAIATTLRRWQRESDQARAKPEAEEA